MSVDEVRRRFVDLLVAGRGRVGEAEYRALIAHAREGGLSPMERAALTDPAGDWAKSRILRSHGIRLEDVLLEEGAWSLAESLAREFALPQLFFGLPNARPARPAAPPVADDRELAAALDRGHDLGSLENWHLQTAGADLSFVTRVGDKKFPAVVLDLPVWKDPAPRDLISGHTVSESFVRETVQREKAWFDAEDVNAKSRNERYGIQDLRREAFFGALKLSPSLILSEREGLICGRDYEMDVGTHTNYWPYWNNFREFLDRMLAQTAPDSDEARAIANRIADILDHKTVFGWSREIDEQDYETSSGGALVHRPPYRAAQRVSLAAGSTAYAPRYEVLTVRTRNLPAELATFAGKPVYRDGTSLFSGKDKLPESAKDHVDAQTVPAGELGLSALGEGETTRKGIPFDWTRDGAVGVAPVEIGWWGHCHNESPLNAMGIDPKTPVELYRADRGVAANAALQKYSTEDIWDVAGALAADHEQGWALPGLQLRATEVEHEQFVGLRNDGGHWLMIVPARGRRVRIEAEVTELWHKSDPTQRYPSPMERFRRDLPAEDGSFAPNPDWVDAGGRDDDEITIDAKGRKLSLTTTYVTVDESGRRVQKKDQVTLDPAVNKPVKIAEEIQDDKIVEHWYEPQAATYFQAVKKNGREIERSSPVAVSQVLASQETTYDSVIEIHDFVTRRAGLPFVFDTSSGMSVWNYPVKKLRIDRLRELQKDGFTYTTYSLAYETMGGPSGKAGYLIKRDAKGNPERALALDPMPDFAFRQEHWVCAPAAADSEGRLAVNLQALRAGFLTDKAYEKIVPELWRRQATLLYASLSGQGWLFETRDGKLIAFKDQASFDAAVAADQKLRSLSR